MQFVLFYFGMDPICFTVAFAKSLRIDYAQTNLISFESFDCLQHKPVVHLPRMVLKDLMSLF